MSVKISQALTAEGVIAYHHAEYAANYSSYYNDRGQATGVWFGKEAEAFGLQPGTPVQLEHFERLANGQDPHSGLQLIGWRTPAVKAQSQPGWVKDDAAWREFLTDIATMGARGIVSDFYDRVDLGRAIVETYEDTPTDERAKIAGELIERYGLAGDREIREKRRELPKPGEPGEKATWTEHRAAWDITFGAPKTVSLTALVGGDQRIIKAHDEAVREGMGYFERAIQVKMGGLNAPQTTGRMVAALFRHDTARPVNGYAAPHLHTHGVTFNMSMDRDGQHRALNPKELFYLQSAAEAVYQNALAVRLKSFGYELEYGKNLAIEIKGYTQEYRDAESQRTAQIEAKKAELGMFGPGANQNIALSTRAEKLDLTADEVRAMHLQKAEMFGNQPQQVVAEGRGRKGETYSDQYRVQVADEAVQFAKHRLSERTTVMEWWEIHRDALRFGRGYITLADVEAAFSRARDRGEFKRTEHWRGYAPEARFTTPDLEDKERQVLAWMAEGRGRVGAIAGGITRDEFREQFRPRLNDGQKWLVWHLIHSEDRMVGVQGLAGTGKTTALRVVQDFAQRYGYEVKGIAATSGAVGELRKVGIEAETLAAFALSRQKQLRPRAYLLDEASLTDIHQMADFLAKLKPADRVIVIGDTKQHASLGAGRIFAELQDAGMQTFHLRKIVRQRPESYREVVQQLSKGQVAAALDSLHKEMRTHIVPNEAHRHHAIALWYAMDAQRTLVISPDNRSRQQISDAIRAYRAEKGELTGEIYRMRALESRSLTKEDLKLAANYNVGDVVEYARDSKKLKRGDRTSVVSVDRDKNVLTVMSERSGKIVDYNPRRTGTNASVYEPRMRELQAGDRVQFTRSMKAEGIANRALGTLEKIDQLGNAWIRLDDGRGWTFNLERMPHLDHGYVMTSYSAQGSTAERVLIHLDTDAPGTSRMLTQQLIYVAASRGRQEMHVFTNAEVDELKEALGRSEEKATALAPEQIEAYSAGISR